MCNIKSISSSLTYYIINREKLEKPYLSKAFITGRHINKNFTKKKSLINIESFMK